MFEKPKAALGAHCYGDQVTTPVLSLCRESPGTQSSSERGAAEEQLCLSFWKLKDLHTVALFAF